ncbi:MAG: HAMP domain-containing histidine kinase [Elusimicrobiaceae bacterium]|nr:HAMP domain-containing histidine kinase [Elusimicrobiaceae bacterium]
MTEKDTLSAKALTLISHKLRTPLSIINGYSEAVLSQATKEKFSPFTTKALGEIHKQGNRMSLLVDKLMAFNQVITADEQTLEKQPVNLKSVIKECAEKAIAQEGVAEKGLPAEQTGGVKRGTFIEIDCSSQLTLNANEHMLKLCISELLANAIKFNNKLEKTIKVQGTNHGDSISISVRDYGVGIRPQDVSKIFEPFYQVDDYFTGQISGWGLGLPMVQRILDLHRGSISVVSDRGLGSIFTLSFPL